MSTPPTAASSAPARRQLVMGAAAGWLALSWRSVGAQALVGAPAGPAGPIGPIGLMGPTGPIGLMSPIGPDIPYGADLPTAIRLWTGGAPLREGRITLELPALVENGNAVPLSLHITSPMTATDHVQAVAVFNELNPQRDVVRFALGPRVGQVDGVVHLHTRVRLATSQKIVALARMADGAVHAHTVEVVVTLAACAEG